MITIPVKRIFIFIFIFTISDPLLTLGQSNSISKPFILGSIEEIYSSVLSEKRILNIYLPEGYNKNDTVTYPTVYMLDGAADEDFIHITGLYQFNNFPWIQRVPKSIIVGIANIDRKRDFTYQSKIAEEIKRYPTAGHSDNFMRFIEKELQPFVNRTFKTNGFNTLIGQSLAGLFATEVLLKKPALFTNYIIISPSLWWDDGSLLKTDANNLDVNKAKELAVYIAAGKEGLAPSTIPHIMEVDANLLVEKLRLKKVSTYYDYLPQEDHATITHQAVFNALRILYPVPVLK